MSALNIGASGLLTRDQLTAVELVLPGRHYTISGTGYSTAGTIKRVAGDPEVALEPFLLGLALTSEAVVTGGELTGDPVAGRARRPGREGRPGCRRHALPLAARRRSAVRRHPRVDGDVSPDGRRVGRRRGPLLRPGRARQPAVALRDRAGAGPAPAAHRRSRTRAVSHRERAARRPGPAGRRVRPPRLHGRRLRSARGCADAGRRAHAARAGGHRRSAARRGEGGGRVGHGGRRPGSARHAAGRRPGAEALARAVGIEGRTITGTALAAMQRPSSWPASSTRSACVAGATPEQRVRLVAGLRRQGHVVAVAGRGLDDAPAVRAADIGLADGA